MVGQAAISSVNRRRSEDRGVAQVGTPARPQMRDISMVLTNVDESFSSVWGKWTEQHLGGGQRHRSLERLRISRGHRSLLPDQKGLVATLNFYERKAA
jgi:hypothetical protein